MYYIYQTKNLIDEKIYVGVHLSNDINNDNYLGSGLHLRRAIKKHGIQNFQRIIIHQTDSKQQAYQIERNIVNDQFVFRNDTYNMKCGGFGGFPKNIWLGKHHSEETKEKCRLKNLGKIVSQQSKKKMSLAKKGKTTWNKGISPSQETKKKRSQSRTGKYVGKDNPWFGKHHSEQTRQKMRKPKSQQHKQKLSETGKKRRHSDQTKAKITQSLKKAWQAKKQII